MERKEVFYNQSEGVPTKIPKQDVVLLMSDFSSKFYCGGSASENLEEDIRRHGVGTLNENGKNGSNL